MLFYVATIVSIPLLFSINQFIDIWYEGEIDTAYLIGVAFSVYLFGYIIKLSITTFVSAAGLFKETKFCAITDTVVNLILSFLLVFKFGISGVIFATAISVFIAEFIMKNIVIHKHIFNRSTNYFYINNLKFCLIALVDYFISNFITIDNIIIWFITYVIYFIVNAIVVFGVYKLINEVKFVNRFKQILGRG